MYEREGESIPLEEAQAAAQNLGLSLDGWAGKYGWAQNEGKTNGSTEITPPMEPVMNTPGGESTSGDTLLELPEAIEYVTLEDLKGSEEEVAKMLNNKISDLGLYVTEGTGMYSFDAINIRKRDEKRGFSPYDAYKTLSTGVEFSPGLSEKDLAEKAAEINSKIDELKNDNYLNEAQERSGAKYPDYKAAVTPEAISGKEALRLYQEEQEDKFSNIERFRDNKGFTVSFENGDFESAEEEEQYKKYLAGAYIAPPPAEKLEEWKAARTDGYASRQSLMFTNKLDNQTRLDLEAIARNEAAVAKRGLEDLSEKYENQNTAYEESYKNFEANPTEETRLIALNDFESLQQTLVEGRELAKNSEGLPLAIKDFGANYNRLQQLTSNFKGMAADANYLTAQLGQLMGDDPKYKEAAFQISAGIKEEQQQFQRSVKVDEIKSLQEAGMWLASATTSLVPSLAMAMTGSAALPLFFATGAGSTGVEIAISERDAAKRMLSNRELLDGNPDMDPLEKASIEEQMQQDSKTLNIPEWRKVTAQVWNGLAEVAFEKTGTLFLLKSLKQGAKLLPPETVKQATVKIGKDIVKGVRIEGASEWATNSFQNFADIYILDEDKNFFEAITDEKLFEGGLETFAQGALMGGGMSIGGNLNAVKEAYFSELATSKQNQRLQEIIKKLEDLTGVKGITNAGEGVPLPQQTQEVQALIEELTGEADDIKNNVIARLGVDLTLKDAKAVGDINRQMRKVNADFRRLAGNPDLSAAQLSAIETEYRAKFDKLAEQREGVLTNEDLSAVNLKSSSGAKVIFDAQSGYGMYKQRMLNESIFGIAEEWNKMRGGKKTEMFNAAKIELEKEAGPSSKAITAEAIEDRAEKDFMNMKYAEKIESGAKNVEDYAKANGINVIIETFDGENASEAFEQKLLSLGYSEEKAREFREAAEDGVTEATNIPGKNGEPDIILVHKPNSVKNKRIGVYAHELLHSIARQKFNSKNVEEAGESLLAYLEKNQPDLYAKVKFRIDQSYTETSADGETTKGEDYYEEAMNAMSDVIADGQQVDKNFLLQARSFVNSFLPSQMQLKSDEATYQFIRGFNKQAHFGGKGAPLNIKVDAVGDRSDEEAPTAKQSRTLLGDINALVPESIKTQEQYFDRKVFNPIYNEGRLHPSIANYIRSRSVSKEEAQKIIESVGDRLINFNPEAKRKSGDARITLGEFIFSNVNFGKLDARKALFEEGQERAQTESTDSETAKQVVAKEETSKPVTDKPTYRSLIQRRVVDADVLESIKVKIKSTVRVMKTRMDESVSKNVTVKPYIAELRKTLGKQADIDLKKAMGKRKDGELRKFLLRNKAAILENMTTTYLMTAMPNAVQKKVDGTWTSDWKGKKIDRESVSTNQAGRTSGAELVRRLPNASTRLSDADYLSNILDASGAPIRGRKESLAKAIAEELSFDIVSEALQDPNSEIRQAYENRQELLGAALTENYVTEVARDVERGNVKFSRTVASAFEGDTQKLLIWESGKKDLASRLSNIGSDISEKALKQELKAVYNDLFTTTQYNALAKELKGIFKNVQNANIEIAKISSREVLKVLEDLANDTDFNENVHRLVGAKSPVAELYRDKNLILEAKASVVEILAKLNVPVGIAKSFVRDTFANSGRIGVFYKDGSSHPKNQTRQDLFFNMADVEASLVGEGKLYSREEWDNANRVNKSTSVTVGFRTGKFDQAADAASAKAAWELTTDIVKSLKSYSPEVQAMIMAAMNSGTSTVLRQAAPVTHRVEGFRSTTAGDWTYEHLVPARLVLSLMYQYHVKGDKSINIDALQKDYSVAIIPKIMDDVVRDAGLQERQIVGYKPGEVSPWKRYYNIFTRGAVQFAVTNIADGTKIGEDYAQAYNAKQYFTVNSEEFSEAVKNIKEIENVKFSKSPNSKALSEEFNNILERKTGVESFKTFSQVQAQMRGAKKGKFKFFIAPSVDDFRGLVNFTFAGKGKQGEIDKQWLEDTFMTPYAKGIAAINGIRQQIKRDFKAAVKAFPKQYQLLNKEIGKTGFTYDQAVRVYLWQKAGIDVPGTSKKDIKILEDAIKANPELLDFAEAMLVVGRRDTWMEPGEYWQGGTVLSDLNSMTEKIGRKKYLEDFIANTDAVFTEANLNKIEALYGRGHRDAIVDALYSMTNGTNREKNTNKQVNAWLNWINGSTGAIMFFNRRSALLQMLSTVNFINWSDNNPVKAAAAFANQRQYWSDWSMIFNSDKLKERRGGLQQDVSSDEIASIANASKNNPQAILAKLLQLGFTPTQIADSMAIATGGAAFYRNRVNKYVKEGVSKKDAEEKAFIDFSKISDETQQSSDPALVSQLQRSNLGRLIFAFQNTPMQMSRLMKKDALDLINGRGIWYEKVGRIAYYGIIQNFIFSALQSALFAMLPGFDDDEDLTADELIKKNEKEEAKIARVLNSMLDTLLKGSGVYGAVFSTVKNIIKEYNKQEKKGFMSNHAYTVLSLFDISPPIGSKARKVHSAIQTKKFEKDEIAARGWGVTADGRLDLGPNWTILGKVLSAAASVPLDRVVDELTSISEAFDARNKAWQRIALAAGWKTWDVGAKEENAEAIKEAAKKQRKIDGVEKSKKKRAETKAAEKREFEEATEGMTTTEKSDYIKELRRKNN